MDTRGEGAAPLAASTGVEDFDDDRLRDLALPILAAADTAQIGISVNVLPRGGSSRRVYVSEAAARILGHTREELLGSSTFMVFAPGEAERMAELSKRWARGEPVPHVTESVVVRKDGTHTPVEAAFSEVTLGDDRATVGFLRDITARRRAEDALRRSERTFRQLIEVAPDAVSVVRAGRFVYANRRLVELVGCASFDELSADPPYAFIHVDDRARFAERERAFASQAAPRDELAPAAEYRVVRKDDGRIVPIECSSLTVDFEGAPATMTFVRDVTFRKAAQAQLMHQDRMATLGTLAAAVAHELNNPLAYMMLNLGTLEREVEACAAAAGFEGQAGAMRERIRMIREGATQMLTVVKDLRSFCRPEGPPRPVDPVEPLEAAIDMAKHEIGAHARLVREYSPVPAVLADPARLGQVFLNLLVNAAHAVGACDGDGADHEVRVVVKPHGEDRVHIAVRDSGVGIAPDVLERIFDPFFTTKLPGVGTGIGLSISKSIVLAMNGELTVESSPGAGSTFSVLLPALGAP